MRVLKIFFVGMLLLALCACAAEKNDAQADKTEAPSDSALTVQDVSSSDSAAASVPVLSNGQLNFNMFAMPDDEYTGVFYASFAEARGLPMEDAAVTGTLENMLTKVYCTVETGDGLWSLVYVVQLGEAWNTLGWVRWETLAPYDAGTMESTLTYPVRARAGMTLTYARTGYTVTTRGDDLWKIEYKKDGTVVLLDAGGAEFPVGREDLIFPRVEGNVIVW